MYATDGTSYSLLKDVVQTGPDGVAKYNNTSFKYGSQPVNFETNTNTTVSLFGVGAGSYSNADIFEADFNADGVTDILVADYEYRSVPNWTTLQKCHRAWRVFIKTATTGNYVQTASGSLSDANWTFSDNPIGFGRQSFITTDFNGDGRADLLLVRIERDASNQNPNPRLVSLKIETTTTTTTYSISPLYNSWLPARSTDIIVTKQRGTQPSFTNQLHFNYNANGSIKDKEDFYNVGGGVKTAYTYQPTGFIYDETSTTTYTVVGTATPITTVHNEFRAASYGSDKYVSATGNTWGDLEVSASWVHHPLFGSVLRKTKPFTGAAYSVPTDNWVTNYEYDVMGKIKKVISPTGVTTTTTWTWDLSNPANPNYYSTVLTDGAPTTKTWYNKFGLDYKVQMEARGTQWTELVRTYDALGRVITQTIPYFQGETPLVNTTNTYDAYNRISSTVVGAKTTTYNYVYGAQNTTIAITTPDGIVTKKTTDITGVTISDEDNGGVLNYTYNSQRNQTALSMNGVVVTTFEYDNKGRQTKLIDANAGTTTYQHNSFGELVYQKDSKGGISVLTYDKFGRVTNRTAPEGITTYEYYLTGTGVSKLKKVTGLGMTQELGYDSYGRQNLIKETLADGTIAQTTTTYDIYGNLIGTTYPSGLVVNRTYDSRGNLLTVKNAAGNLLFDAQVANATNALGRYTNYKLGNGLSSNITYNSYGVATDYKAGTGSGTSITPTVQNYHAEWNIFTGNLSSRTDVLKNKTENFTYDNLNRLTAWQVAGGTLYNNTYPQNGNITTKSDAGSYSYNPTKTNMIAQIDGFSNISPQTQLVTYTTFNQPNTITENNYALTLSYAPDYQRRKTVETLNGTAKEIRYFFGNYEKQVLGSTTNEIHYIDGGNGLCAIAVRTNGIDTYYTVYTDHLGSIVTLTNNTGNIIAEQNFDPWGRRRNTTNWTTTTAPVATPTWLYRGYTGHEDLRNFALINMNGRLYDPVMASMLSPDNYAGAGTQGYNRYIYVTNNPLKYTDPNGEHPLLIAMAVGAGIGVLSNWDNMFDADGKFQFNTFAKSFGQGAVIGAVGGLVGAASVAGIAAIPGAGVVFTATSGAVAGATQGAISGAASGAASGALTAVFQGKSGQEVLGGAVQGFFMGGFSGAVTGGILGGLKAVSERKDFFTGSYRTYRIPERYYASIDKMDAEVVYNEPKYRIINGSKI